MRIVHVILSLRPRRGGPPIVAASLAAAQAAAGHHVRLISYAHADAPGIADPELLGEHVPGWSRVEHIRLPMPPLSERLLARRMRSAVRAIASDVDVVHLHQVWEPLIAVAAAELRRAGVPYVLTPHGMLHPWSLGQSPVRKRIALAFTHRRALGGSAVLHALNDEERDQLARLNLGPRIAVVPNGVWPARQDDSPPPAAFRGRWPALGEAPFVLFMSRLHHKKGPDILVSAFAALHRRLPEVRLVIAGDDSGARADLERRIAAEGLGERALLVGPIYGEQKRAALAEAACFCLPSRQEGFPVAVLEALAAGVPAVISRECYFPEVQEQQAGFVLPLDAQAFAEAMERLLRNDGLRQRMGLSARAMVERDYTWPRIAAQMLAVYEQLAPQR